MPSSGWVEPVSAHGGMVLYVRLTCERETWLARVANETRLADDKLTDPVRAVELFDGRGSFLAMPMEPTLLIDTTHLPPSEAAAEIVAHYRLALVGDGQCRDVR
jgi:hypothetical protein